MPVAGRGQPQGIYASPRAPLHSAHRLQADSGGHLLAAGASTGGTPGVCLDGGARGCMSTLGRGVCPLLPTRTSSGPCREQAGGARLALLQGETEARSQDSPSCCWGLPAHWGTRRVLHPCVPHRGKVDAECWPAALPEREASQTRGGTPGAGVFLGCPAAAPYASLSRSPETGASSWAGCARQRPTPQPLAGVYL